MKASDVIATRKAMWEKSHDYDQDAKYRFAIAEHIASDRGAELRRDVQERPEALIEMLFVIVDKGQRTVPFFLNDVQRSFANTIHDAVEEYRQGKRLSLQFLVLKGRQQGFTSFITAYQLALSITRRNFAGFTLTDNSENTEAIFTDKAKFPYDNLPILVKPTEKYNNRRELHFDKINSRWRVATAGSKDVGRSKTLNFFHGSEAAFWDGLSKILLGLSPALTKDSIRILESTANGYNEFKDLWDKEIWTNLFYEWWKTSEYHTPFPTPDAEQEFMFKAQASTEWIYDRCRWLHDTIGLSWEQVYWYYNQFREYGEGVKQEYPCSSDEAFLASGACVFDKEQVIRRKVAIAGQSVKIGSFDITWNDPETKDKIIDYRFVEHTGGFIRIYREPSGINPYVVGCDTKGEGSDFFAACVVDNVTDEQAAAIHGQMDAGPYTHQLYCLGMYYNRAMIGVEVNFDTFPIIELERLRYPHQYIRKTMDTYTGKLQERFGWRTDGGTRPLIISRMIELVRDHVDIFNDATTLDEMLTFVRDENGRPDAESGKHDDMLFASMIAYQIREQQSAILPAQTFDLSKLPKDVRRDYQKADTETRKRMLAKWGYIKDE